MLILSRMHVAGTVCILGRNDEEGEAAVAKVVEAYSKETGGFAPNMFSGSSMGAAAFGKLRVKLKAPAPSSNRVGARQSDVRQ